MSDLRGGSERHGHAIPDRRRAPLPDTRWRTRDIVVAAVIGVAFGVVFWAWGLAWAAARAALRRRPAAAGPALRGLARPGRARPARSSASPAPRSSPRWSPPACRRSSAASGAWTRCCPASSRAPRPSSSSPSRSTASGRSRSSPSRRSRAPLAAWVHDWVLYYAESTRRPARPRRRDGDLGGRHRGRRLGRARARARAGRRARRVPGLSADAPEPAVEVVARDLVGHLSRRGAAGLRRGLDSTVEPGACLLVVGPVGVRQEHARAGHRGPRPARDPGRRWPGSLDRRRPETRACRRPRWPRGSGSCSRTRARQLVMERVEDDVAFGLENRGWPVGGHAGARAAGPRRGRAARLERRRSNRLSGGQQQRLALAGVLAPRRAASCSTSRPPTSTRTAPRRCSIDCGAVRAAGDTTLILIEHHVEDAWPLADLVLALDRDGRPSTSAPPDGCWRDRATGCAAAGIWLPGDRVGRRSGDADAEPSRRAGSAGRRGARRARSATSVAPLVLDGVDLAVGAGERIALVGAERQRQVDARRGCSSGCCDRTAARCGWAATIRRACRRPCSPGARAMSSRTRSRQFLADRVATR